MSEQLWVFQPAPSVGRPETLHPIAPCFWPPLHVYGLVRRLDQVTRPVDPADQREVLLALKKKVA